MASRSILRRRKFVSDYLNVSARSIRSFQSLGHGQSNQYVDSRGLSSGANHPSGDIFCIKDGDAGSAVNEDLLKFSALGIFKHRCYGVTASGHVNGRSQFILPMGMRLMPQSIHYASTATAGKPDLGSDDEDKEELVAEKRKEASPEECDQAVEGLSTAKAKAKAKRLQESEKVAKSALQRVWATLLGIGPALRAVASMSREDWAKKLSHWKNEFISTLQHYWLGCKLLWVDVRISSRLLLKLAGGKSLTRRERQQLTRTTADIFRLVPFAVFIIVPFMEFLLPVFLAVFPNMLPSTFQDKMKEQEALKRRLNARIEYAKFLQGTVKEMAKEVQSSRSGETKKTAEDLDEFLTKVRRGAGVSNEEILSFAKLFNDELTLDNISRPRLVNMCKYMGINPYGTDAYLRFMLRKRLQWIKNDDKMIQAEGLESLSEAELREDCRERGMLGLLSVEEMRQQLRDWLDLSLNHSVPSSLLILSRAFTVSGKLKPEEIVGATLSSLPDEVVDTVGVVALPSEDSVSERRRKLEFLEMQEELIKEEQEKEEEEHAKKKESAVGEEDVALKEMVIPTAREAQDQARERTLEKQEHLCELSRALAVLASASSVSREREEFLRLVNKEIELYNSMVDKEGTDEVEAMKAYKAAREESDQASDFAVHDDEVSSALVDRVDAMLQKLEKEIDDVDAKIGDRWRLLDRDYDGKVTPEEVAAAATYLKDTLGKDGIQELISNLSKDPEGKILVEDIVRLGSRAEDGSTAEVEGR
ncbi:mitochondrial proton/calcium exchanger protein-like isoform X3 [Camellia sinensis]|uniref:mitochondrial proton/calcium exchanger protein-like isoform X1 n=1 Tax=Camellia sinensis TaxID=4442 RepID=UPI001035D4A0|nr:mitochondrial proton/calcium exchanger protein-like isoform X1 [Camellia sinensis]XP_028070226.1 mitochondrial proton/calcium exchanger protein-like isoform X1 [Camellia sinensis]XP_028070227.1 mitochondrial proton/calcium exchanger protein-like isoform X1 [Camellia sinensis]XP_028070228.1 mitochondrial proton/calcium exchanger protein-like isoform X1 [Camellia sinensis]XP_028070230.1 mitochondrial proton/calcium exchanger protein-like isoform X3 [Camellia sinensis]